MNPDDFESRMRALEYYHSLRLVPGAWTVIRVDGRGFTRLTGSRFEKPFDPRFRDLMADAAEALAVGRPRCAEPGITGGFGGQRQHPSLRAAIRQFILASGDRQHESCSKRLQWGVVRLAHHGDTFDLLV